jgi:class 3 adenylate cyclase/tetratricopeptide (TPR) repeat protein
MHSLSNWLDSLGLVRYADVFEENGIDLDSLSLLDDGDLEKLGVLLGHRKRLLKAIAELTGGTNAPDIATQTGPSIDHTTRAEGERRQATVLFSDLSGYTAMNEKLDPEVVAEIVGRIKAEAVKIVESHGGIVNQFVGDEILALFGVPIAHEDDPVRAVRAALALHRMVREIAPSVEVRIGQPVRLHTGIDTGLVVTNLRDRRDGTFGITGDAVNTGARLAAQSPTDEIWVSPQTHQRTADYFETQALSAVTLKGKAEPLKPHRILGPTSTETRFEAAQRRGLTGFTGRGQEFSTLLACLERTQSGDGQFVVVIGEAGAGKSRLLFEFRNGLPRDKVGALQGRCQSYGTETPYLPFLDALRRALDLREDDSPERLLDKAVANVRAVDPALESFLPHYLHLLSISSEQYSMPPTLQGAERKRAFEEALAAIFTLAAKRQPLAIVLEDWHWVDATSDAVLKRLVGLIADYPLMIVLLCRPEYELNWAAPSQLTRIVVKPLSIADTAAMACTALKVDSMPEELKGLIHERTVGNPLFIEEVCHTLVEEAIIRVNAGKVALARRIETVHLPDTVQAVIRARVDRLDKESQAVLQLASVIGREFARSLLERLAAANDNLGQTLDSLRSQDLIRQVRVLPEPQYIFKHVLTQVVVYETLLLMRRQMLHEMVGQAIEELYSDRLEEHYESLAYHYQHSGNREKALHYLELAGDKANAQYALEQALKNYRQAMVFLGELERTSERMRRHVDIAVKWANLVVPSRELIEALGTAKAYAERLQDHDRFAKATSFLGQVLLYMGEFEPAILELKRVVELEAAPQGRVGSSYRCLAQIYISTSRDEGIAECLECAKPMVRFAGDRFEESCCFFLEGWWLGSIGRFRESWSKFEEAIRVARLGGERSIEVWNLTMWGVAKCVKGDWSAALEMLSVAIELGERIENIWAVKWATLVRCYANYMCLSQPASLGLMADVLRWKEESGDLLNISLLNGFMAEALYFAERFDEAAKYVERALDGLATGSAFGAEPRAYRIRAMTAARKHSPDWTAICADLDRSLVTATAFGYRPELALVHASYAKLLRDRGDLGQARSHLAEAEELFTKTEMTWWLEQFSGLRAELKPS